MLVLTLPDCYLLCDWKKVGQNWGQNNKPQDIRLPSGTTEKHLSSCLWVVSLNPCLLYSFVSEEASPFLVDRRELASSGNWPMTKIGKNPRKKENTSFTIRMSVDNI